MESFNFTADQLFFAGKIGILMKGTSDDDLPIPGYLYKEVNDISFQSPAHCEFLLEFLIKRLSKNSYHVKYKALRLLKHIVEKGEPTFKIGLRRYSAQIQEATKFGGPPDPLHGHLPYQLVRKTAKELSQLVFDVDEAPRMQSDVQQEQTPTQKKIMVGIGPMYSSKGGKYQGFGNTPMTEKSLKTTLQEGLEKLAEQFSETPGQRQAALLAKLSDNSAGDYVPPVVSPDPPTFQSSVAIEKTHPQPAKIVHRHRPGRAGGGWDEEEGDSEQVLGSDTRSEGSGGLTERLQGVSTPDWSAEEHLVTEYLHLRDRSQFLLLRPSQMKEFKRKCQLMNCEKVVDFLHNRMHSTDNYVIVRAMLLLETFLVRSDAVSLDYIACTCKDQLLSLVHNNDDQCIVDKATKIITGLECYSSYKDILPVSEN